MSYTRGMGDTASDIARVAAAAAGAAATLIGAAAGTTPGTTATTIDPATGLPSGTVNPATGMPYGAINPSTGLPYGTPEETSYVPIIIGGLALAGLVGLVVMRRSRTTPNRRRHVRRNSRGGWIVPQRGSSRFTTKAEADKLAAHFKTAYGPGVYNAKVVREPSKSRPGANSYQVYIKPTPAYLKILRSM